MNPMWWCCAGWWHACRNMESKGLMSANVRAKKNKWKSSCFCFTKRFAPTCSLTAKPTANITAPMFTWLTPYILKMQHWHGQRATLSYINENIIHGSRRKKRDAGAVLFYIELKLYPLLRCPIISFLSIYFSFPSCQSRHPTLPPTHVWLLWCFLFISVR